MNLFFNSVEPELKEFVGPPRGSSFNSMIFSFLVEKMETSTHGVLMEY